MKRRTETQTKSLCYNKETLSIRNGIINTCQLLPPNIVEFKINEHASTADETLYLWVLW